MSTTTTQEPVKVGDVLYREVQHRGKPSEIVEATVGKVARKYFYLIRYRNQIDDDTPINRETLKYENQNYSQLNFRMYRTRQEIVDKKERERLTDCLRQHFVSYDKYRLNTLDELREAASILGIEPTEDAT